ncbi:MAG TPA: 2,3-bisphosphoglycerate-independent phosphoglycerate mutase [Longimicrobiales bacterium]|nr:2,3-bisphosphoglycerate-independent phosphoglycerate mutase [Longimicrobiales bacterium]
MDIVFPDSLADAEGGRIVLLVLDGLGGLPHEQSGLTELESARTPNLDRLARSSSLGMHQPVGWGITPGSGPGHLALFGYDPVRFNIGRGVLSALGVGFALQPGDIAIRLNLATIDAEGRITDRRAGRPSDAENRRLIEKLRAEVQPPGGLRIFFESEKEHRAVLVLRGRALSAALADTDPQETGVPPLPATATDPAAVETAALLQAVLDRAFEVLREEPQANALLARGIDAYHAFPTFTDRFRLKARAIAKYPMYRGVARLVGMDQAPVPGSDEETVATLEQDFASHDFHFVHFKAIDSRGEDGDFDAKVAAIEAIDALLPRVAALRPDVLVVTGDHSTPSRLRAHSWHPVPLLLASPWARPQPDATFGERSCQRGELGIFPAMQIMTLALAHARRLSKYGA